MIVPLSDQINKTSIQEFKIKPLVEIVTPAPQGSLHGNRVKKS
jgi:hypothetical protein